jgi:hypothetical protein
VKSLTPLFVRRTGRGASAVAAVALGLSSILTVAAPPGMTTSIAAPPAARPVPQGTPLPDLTVSVERLRDSLDLRTRRAGPASCALAEACLGGTGVRRTLEFDTQIINQGTVDVRFGNPADQPELFEWSACHGHFHLKDSLDYSLAHGGSDTASLYDPAASAFFLRNANAAGVADVTFSYGAAGAGFVAFSGDWDGDGDSTPGLYDPVSGAFFLKNTNAPGPADITFRFGPAGAQLRPFAGDWDGDSTDTIGLYDGVTGSFFLRNTNAPGPADAAFRFGPAASNSMAIAGDWDGDDRDSIGLYNGATGVFFLMNTNGPGPADIAFTYGAAGGGFKAIVGDWDASGTDTPGLYAPSTGAFFLKNANSPGPADIVFGFGPPSAGLTPVAGDWDYELGPALPATGHKQAFCWIDSQRIFGDRPQQFTSCSDDQGITAGWSDIYGRGLDCQWIDIEGLAAGNYQLRVDVNNTQLVAESNYSNNTAVIEVHIPAPGAVPPAPKVNVTAPKGGERFRVGKPVRIRWEVENGRNVTHQELWLVYAKSEIHDHNGTSPDSHDRQALAKIIDDKISPAARSYTWVPTEDFLINGGQIMVRAQDDRNHIGTDENSKGRIKIQMK